MDVSAVVGRFRDYLTVELRLSDRTVETYLRECHSFATYMKDEGLDASEVDAEKIIAYLVRRQEDGLDQRTIAKVVSSLRSFFQFLVLTRMRNDNPALIIDMPKAEHRVPGVLRVEEVERILETIDVSTPHGLRDRALFELIYSCGLRISEAVELTRKKLYLREGLLRVRGKGNKERLVPIGGEAVSWLERYLEHGRPQLAKNGRSKDYLFLNHLGSGLSRKGIWKRFRELTERVGLAAKVHTLRHSFATHLLDGGADLRSVQELLGHADISTTQIYTHVDRDDLRSYHKDFHPRS